MVDVPAEPLADFLSLLSDLRLRSGQPSLVALERLTARGRNRLPRSTLHQKLRGDSPPDWEFVSAFVTACLDHASRHRSELTEQDRNIAGWHARHERMLADLAATRSTERRSQAAAQLLAAQTGARTVVVPRQLPPDVAGFVGRHAELDRLDQLTMQGDEAQAVPVVVAVCGTAGVGKTALVLRWAHRAAHRFTDGQLYIDLRGFDPDEPVAAGDALAAMLRAVGVGGADIPYDAAERAACWRTAVDGRRLLVVLDNASNTDQIRQLLPGSPTCCIVVTSRDSLAGLVARHGAQRVAVPLLPLSDAVDLLKALVGERTSVETTATTGLVTSCAGLPLALRVVAELAASQPDRTLEDLVQDLADDRRRLAALEAGQDRRTAVRNVLFWSYRRQTAEVARMMRMLAVHPCADLGLAAATAMADLEPTAARHALDDLIRAHLVEYRPGNRYAMHDLLRAFASERADTEDDQRERQAALYRLVDYYVAFAITLGGTRTTAATDAIVSPDARAQLDAERPNLVAVTALAARSGWSEHVITLADALADYLFVGAHYGTALQVQAHALYGICQDFLDTELSVVL